VLFRSFVFVGRNLNFAADLSELNIRNFKLNTTTH